MTEDIRVVKEGTQYIGEDEEIVYDVTTTPWGSSPSAVSVVVYDITTGAKEDVSDEVLEGVAGIVGDKITLPKVKDLTAGSTYRVEVLFTTGSNKFEIIIPIVAQD
jgi:hypothetical protein